MVIGLLLKHFNAMNSNEIEAILRRNKQFLGCFAWDQLPQFPSSLPKSIIINTGKSDSSGEHWVAIVLQKNKCFYFDSFGLPIINDYILDFLDGDYNKVTYTDNCIQSINSDMCGKFCIAFIKHVNSKLSYNTFIEQFDFVKLYKNDEIVENIYM